MAKEKMYLLLATDLLLALQSIPSRGRTSAISSQVHRYFITGVQRTQQKREKKYQASQSYLYRSAPMVLEWVVLGYAAGADAIMLLFLTLPSLDELRRGLVSIERSALKQMLSVVLPAAFRLRFAPLRPPPPPRTAQSRSLLLTLLGADPFASPLGVVRSPYFSTSTTRSLHLLQPPLAVSHTSLSIASPYPLLLCRAPPHDPSQIRSDPILHLTRSLNQPTRLTRIGETDPLATHFTLDLTLNPNLNREKGMRN